jgi:acyl phosphate:glycerol-3-phosphate acyltransferase
VSASAVSSIGFGLAVGIGYLVGSIPFGLILGRLVGGADVRRLGSGNIGATNVARSLGTGTGVLTLALDSGKGALCVLVGRAVTGLEAGAVAGGMAALIGHVFPLYLRFRGGKGVATGFGAFLALDPAATLGSLALFTVMLAWTRRVSMGSVVASASLPALLLIRGDAGVMVAAGILSALLILIRHRENLRRIRAGTEPRLGEGNRS